MRIRRFISLALAAALLLCCAGSAAAEETAAGVWKAVTVIEDGRSVSPEDKGITAYLILLPDGSGSVVRSEAGDSAYTDVFTYTRETPDQIAATWPDDSETEGTLSDDSLVLADWTGTTLEYRKIAGDSPAAVQADSTEQFFGRWVFSRMKTGSLPYLLNREIMDLLHMDWFKDFEMVIDEEPDRFPGQALVWYPGIPAGYLFQMSLQNGALQTPGVTMVLTDSGEIGIEIYKGMVYFKRAEDAAAEPEKTAGGFFVEYATEHPEGLEGDFPELMEETLCVIRDRLDEIGLADAQIWQLENNGIRVEVPTDSPDADTVSSVLDLIGRKGLLEFKDPDCNTFMTGNMVKFARYEYDSDFNDHKVCLELTEQGARIFADVTSKSVGQAITILLDGEELSAPVIQAPITDGDVNIYGMKNAEEGKAIAKLINSGALMLVLTQDYLDAWPGR